MTDIRKVAKKITRTAFRDGGWYPPSGGFDYTDKPLPPVLEEHKTELERFFEDLDNAIRNSEPRELREAYLHFQQLFLKVIIEEEDIWALGRMAKEMTLKFDNVDRKLLSRSGELARRRLDEVEKYRLENARKNSTVRGGKERMRSTRRASVGENKEWILTLPLNREVIRDFHNRGVWVRWSRNFEEDYEAALKFYLGSKFKDIGGVGVEVGTDSLVVSCIADEGMLDVVEEAMYSAAESLWAGFRGDREVYNVFKDMWERTIDVEGA